MSHIGSAPAPSASPWRRSVVLLTLLALPGCVTIRYQRPGSEVTPRTGETLVFGRVRLFHDRREFFPWKVSLVGDPVATNTERHLWLLRLGRRAVSSEVHPDPDGSLAIWLGSGDYALLGVRRRPRNADGEPQGGTPLPRRVRRRDRHPRTDRDRACDGRTAPRYGRGPRVGIGAGAGVGVGVGRHERPRPGRPLRDRRHSARLCHPRRVDHRRRGSGAPIVGRTRPAARQRHHVHRRVLEDPPGADLHAAGDDAPALLRARHAGPGRLRHPPRNPTARSEFLARYPAARETRPEAGWYGMQAPLGRCIWPIEVFTPGTDAIESAGQARACPAP